MTATGRAAADTLVDRPSLRSLVEDLRERRERAKLGGGEERIAQQHERDKLTARERLALLIDDGTFTEIGIQGRPHFSQRAMEGREAPADGVVTGYGKVDGRLVAVAAYDFTVMAGSMGMTGELKVSRLRDLALGKRIPMVWLLDSDGDCIQAIKDYLSFFPPNCEEPPPRGEGSDPLSGGDSDLLDVLPDSPRKPYDMYDVIRRIVDGGRWFDLKPRWARTIITCLARMDGRPVGIVANQPKHLGGILENDSADKAARFINLCDAFGIPLLFLMDVPGFMVGTKVEQAGIIRHGAKMLYAVSRATVPKITVVIRKAYGAGYYVMCGKAYEPDLIVAWPSAEISVMGPEGAVNIIFRKQIEASADPDATRAEMIEGIRRTIDPYIAAGNAMVDDIIDPRETRPTVIRALEMAATKRVARPFKRHGVMPV